MKRITAFLLVIFLVFGTVTTSAITEKEYREKRERLKNKIKQNNDKNKEAESIIGVEEKNIKSLDAEIRNKQSEIDSLSNDISVSEGNINAAKEEIDAMNQRLAEKEKLFTKRVRAMYMRGNVGYLSVLLNSKNIHDYLSNQSLVQLLLKQDQDLIKYISDGKEEVEAKKAEIEKEVEGLNQKKGAIEVAKKEQQKILNEKSNYIISLRQSVKQREKENEEFERDQKKLESEIQAARKKYSAQMKSVKYTGGKVGWPLAAYSRISSGYGYRGDPLGGRVAFHSGVDIPAPMGTSVLAGESGVVIYAGWMGSYGNLVVIQHSGALSTAYGHNSAIVVRVGQIVQKGQVVAKIGSTGRSTGPHCHYEVRINGRAVNPLGYVGRSS